MFYVLIFTFRSLKVHRLRESSESWGTSLLGNSWKTGCGNSSECGSGIIAIIADGTLG